MTVRAHAMLNDNAIMRATMTIEDYLESRYIVRPIHLFDMCLVNDGGWASTAASNVSGAFGCPVLDYPTYGLCVTRPAGVIKPAHIRTCSYRAGSLTGLRGFLRGLGPSYLFPRAATRLCSPIHNRAGRLEQVTTANA